MNEHQAMMALPRRPEMIARELEAHRYHYDQLRKLASEFAAMDLRPFIIEPGSMTLTYTRDFEIPENLKTMLRDEYEAIHALEIELYGSRRPVSAIASSAPDPQ